MISHSYPHDWRSKTPTIFRATEQWFISVDRPTADDGVSLRKMALDRATRDDEHAVEFIPAWGRNRLAGMLETRPDWCISRQRSWGLPIPVFYNEQDEVLLTPSSVRATARCFAEHGSDAWFTMTPEQILADYSPENDPDLPEAEPFAKDKLRCGKDIFDVWFESGSSWYAVAIRRGLADAIPVDLYLEGSDQHRGWFQLSLLPALGVAATPPFRTLLTHGFIVDEQGEKMSKSRGNTVDVVAQLEKRGADILRLWAASQNYQDDIRCGENLIAQTEDAYRKIRNTLRFAMMACCDFDPAADAEEPTEHSVDLWMRMQLHLLLRDVRTAYDRYEFHRAMRLIYEFCTVQASSVYFSAIKDRLYCESPDAIRRRASQTVTHELLMTLVKLLAPVMPHTAEDAWTHIPNKPDGSPESVHLATLPEWDAETLEWVEDFTPINPDQMMWSGDRLQVGPGWVWEQIMTLRAAGLAELENLRNAGVKNPLDAEAVFRVPQDHDETARLIETYLHELEDLLGVGYARIERSAAPAEDAPGLGVSVEVLDAREKYPRCERSWKRRPDVGSVEGCPDLSARDAAVLAEREGQ